jgi:hypothetical protein
MDSAFNMYKQNVCTETMNKKATYLGYAFETSVDMSPTSLDTGF